MAWNSSGVGVKWKPGHFALCLKSWTICLIHIAVYKHFMAECYFTLCSVIRTFRAYDSVCASCYSGRKKTESLGKVTVKGEKDGKSKRGARLSTVSLSMYSITENIYYSQLSSVAILLKPETVSLRIIQGNECVFSPSVLSSFGLPLPPPCLLLTVNDARSYFASTII
jgi:hypothetical protein